MRLEEMMQHVQQGPHMLAVAARLRRPHIIDNHVTNLTFSGHPPG
jgi:hypothetical protein